MTLQKKRQAVHLHGRCTECEMIRPCRRVYSVYGNIKKNFPFQNRYGRQIIVGKYILPLPVLSLWRTRARAWRIVFIKFTIQNNRITQIADSSRVTLFCNIICMSFNAKQKLKSFPLSHNYEIIIFRLCWQRVVATNWRN